MKPMRSTLTFPAVKRWFDESYPRATFVTTGDNGKQLLDTAARREAWNDFTDALWKDGLITTRAYDTWGHPRGWKV